jgi:hypothetical protein
MWERVGVGTGGRVVLFIICWGQFLVSAVVLSKGQGRGRGMNRDRGSGKTSCCLVKGMGMGTGTEAGVMLDILKNKK